MAKLFKADGSEVEFDVPKDVELEFLQAKIDGGYIEFVYFGDGSAFMIDEEGKLKGLPRNNLATAIAWLKAPRMAGWDAIVGPAVFFSAAEMQQMNDDEDAESLFDRTDERSANEPSA